MARCEELTNEQWALLKPLFDKPPTVQTRGRPRRADREVLNDVLWILRSGARWCDLPGRFPPYQTCHRRFQEWVRDGRPEAGARNARRRLTDLVRTTLVERFTDDAPERLIGDKAYDSDPLDEELAEAGIELIAPHKANRKRAVTQDGRKLRRYKRRWKVERLFAWLQNFRRILVRYEYHDENYLGFVHLGCMLILLRAYF